FHADRRAVETSPHHRALGGPAVHGDGASLLWHPILQSEGQVPREDIERPPRRLVVTGGVAQHPARRHTPLAPEPAGPARLHRARRARPCRSPRGARPFVTGARAPALRAWAAPPRRARGPHRLPAG